MNPILIFVTFCILATIWTGIWGWVLFSSRRPSSYPQIETSASTLRKRLFYLASGVVIAAFLVSIYWFPYAFIRGGVLGASAVKVNVLAEQWSWTFSQNKFRTDVPVEFDVTSKDVNHDFGLYNPEGHLVGQVQAMPGYTNHLIFTFREPGTFTVRCLELCGTPHFLMQSKITVTR